MGFRINTNVAALASQRAMSTVNRETEESLGKLSSGQRITKASDDAAGLAISEKLKAHIRSSKQANRNANDAISLVQVAEGGLNESSSILTRMRELAIQAATDTLSDTERGLTDYEYQTLKNELDRIAQVTQFNGKKVLNGTNLALDFQVGVGEDSADDRISMNTASFNATTVGLGVSGLSVGSKASAQNSIANIGMALDKLSSQRSLLGSIQNRLMVSSSNLDTYGLNMSASNSRIRDLDYAEEASKQARNSVVQSAATAVGAQANTQGSNALKLL